MENSTNGSVRSFFIRTFLHRFWPVYSRLVVWLRGWEWAVSVLLSGVVAAFIVVPAAIAIANLAGALVGTYDWLNMQVAGPGGLLAFGLVGLFLGPESPQPQPSIL